MGMLEVEVILIITIIGAITIMVTEGVGTIIGVVKVISQGGDASVMLVMSLAIWLMCAQIGIDLTICHHLLLFKLEHQVLQYLP